jgi:hypothetical protein
MSQNSGKKIPMMNITQCPFRMEKMPKVTSRTKYRIPRPTNAPLLTASGGGIGGNPIHSGSASASRNPLVTQ